MIHVILSLDEVTIRQKKEKTFLNSFREKDVKAQVEFTLKVTERARITCY